MIERSITPEAKRLYHVLLRMVADQSETLGAFPEVSDAHAAGNLDAFGALVDAGLIAHDSETGLVTAVLPFVANDPATLVMLDGDEQQQRRAASIPDAFALAPLLLRQVRIDDTCPTCGEAVNVLTDPDRIVNRQPRSAVAIRISTGNGTIRLACSPEHARSALDASGDPEAVMLSIENLLISAREAYAAVLP
jgi:hypothetical protein